MLGLAGDYRTWDWHLWALHEVPFLQEPGRKRLLRWVWRSPSSWRKYLAVYICFQWSTSGKTSRWAVSPKIQQELMIVRILWAGYWGIWARHDSLLPLILHISSPLLLVLWLLSSCCHLMTVLLTSTPFPQPLNYLAHWKLRCLERLLLSTRPRSML